MAGEVSVRGKDRGLAEALERGYTLPAEWYTDPAVFELEKKRIFHRFWQYVGYTEQVAQPGDFFTCQAGDVPIVVLRDTDGALQAFANVCRHRGSTLVLDAVGTRKTIQCHYHGWTWDLDGSLRSAPRWNEQPDFDKEEFPLWRLKVETWGPLIFVNPDPAAGPLQEILGELPQLFASTGLDVGPLRFRKRLEYDIAANWKVIAENFNECYHCPVAHPSFSDLIDIETYKVVTEYDYFSTQHGQVRDEAKEERKPELYDVSDEVLSKGVREGLFSLLFPTAMINTVPGPGNLAVLSPVPIDPNRTFETFDFFFVDELSDDDAREIIEFGDRVQREDIVLCESVQRGLRSGFYTQGRLMLSRENGVQHFQRLVYRMLSDE